MQHCGNPCYLVVSLQTCQKKILAIPAISIPSFTASVQLQHSNQCSSSLQMSNFGTWSQVGVKQFAHIALFSTQVSTSQLVAHKNAAVRGEVT